MSVKYWDGTSWVDGIRDGAPGKDGKDAEIDATLSIAGQAADAAAVRDALANAIGALDVASTGGSGKYIQAISQTDGKISATAATMPTSLKNPNALTAGSVTYDGSAAKTITASTLGINDYVTAKGTSGGWTYRKWNSGVAECWRRISFTTSINGGGSGGIYYAQNNIASASYPFTFSATPAEFVSALSLGEFGVLIGSAGKSNNSTTKTGTYCLFSDGSRASSNFYISQYVVGKWK